MAYKARSANLKKSRRNGQWRFNLTGDNGEVIATSEQYKTKAKAIKTLNKYFPGFGVITYL